MLRAWQSVELVAMVTMFDEDGARSRSHGLQPAVIAAQAARLALQQFSARCSWDTYTAEYVAMLTRVRKCDITHVVFGDIAGDGHREWNERVCLASGLTPIMPLWGQPTPRLAREFLAEGGEARLVTIRAPPLDRSWLGRTLSEDVVRDLESLGVDPCGEFGEYHSVVTNCPRFSAPLPLVAGEAVRRGDCWALDLSVG